MIIPIQRPLSDPWTLFLETVATVSEPRCPRVPRLKDGGRSVSVTRSSLSEATENTCTDNKHHRARHTEGLFSYKK